MIFQPQIELKGRESVIIGKDLGYYTQKQPLESSVRKALLRNFAKFTGKHLCQSLLFNKVSLQLYQKRDPGTGVFL